MKQLHLSEDLSLPINIATQRLAWVGTSGGGKSYGAMRLAELMIEAKIQVVALDPVGIWWGLGLSADGKKRGIPIPVFGGLHGHYPIEPAGGSILADLIIDEGLTCVIDVSQFEYDTDKSRFACDFMSRFFFRKKSSPPSVVHIPVEECQEFVPQNPQRGEEKMLHAFVRTWKIGRNFGIGGSLISQRPQEINKKALNLSHTMFAFQTTGSHERKALKEWMEDKNVDLNLIDELPKLKNGCPYVWGPGWLPQAKIIRISKKWTYDSSSTPEVGASGKIVEPRLLAPVEVKNLSERMKASVDKAKEGDPVELKRRIVGLEDMIRKEKALVGKLSERPAELKFDAKAMDAAIEKQILELQKKMGSDIIKKTNSAIVSSAIDIVGQVEKNHIALLTTLRTHITALETKPIIVIDPKEWAMHGKEIKKALSNPAMILPITQTHVVHRPQDRSTTSAVVKQSQDGIKLPAGALRMLRAVVQWGEKGIPLVQMKTQATIKHNVTLGDYKNKLLRQGLMVEQNGLFFPTNEGIALVGDNIPAPKTTDEVLAAWEKHFPDGARRILRSLVSRRGEYMGKEELMQESGIAHPVTFGDYKNKLKSAHLIVESHGQFAANKETLFM